MMRLRLRESGFSTFTLERPAALYRSAHSNMSERIVPRLRRTREHLAARVASAVDAVGPWATRSAAHVRKSVLTVHERTVPWVRHTRSRLGERLASTKGAVVPWLSSTQAQLRQRARGFSETAAPRLSAARERFEARAVSTVDSLQPWLARARQYRRRRIEALRESANARRKAGVPIWVTVLLVVVTGLVAQALAHSIIGKRHELESRQLTLIHKTEQAAAQASAIDALVRESDDVHRTLGRTIAWTIANELAQKKNGELNLYFLDLAKNERIDLIVFADTSGKVTLASDSALRGTDFAQHFPSAFLQEATVSIYRTGGGTNRLVIPVHRLGTRLGTAVLVYKGR